MQYVCVGGHVKETVCAVHYFVLEVRAIGQNRHDSVLARRLSRYLTLELSDVS